MKTFLCVAVFFLVGATMGFFEYLALDKWSQKQRELIFRNLINSSQEHSDTEVKISLDNRSDGEPSFDVYARSSTFKSPKLFTVRLRGTNIFITTTNEVSCDQFWGPDDKYEVRFWKKEEAK